MSQTDYHVRLAFTMNSESASDAVQDVIDTFTEKGFRDLVYVVDEIATGKRLGYFNGWGEQLDTAVVEARAAQLRQSPREDVPEPVVPDTLDASEYGDDDLEQLAAELNDPGDDQE